MIDMAALAAQNERTRAVGNVPMNARGDRLNEDGTVKQTGQVSFNNKGEKDGVWLVYDHNSKLRVKMFYENGIRKGKWKVYDKHGNLINERDYSKSN